MSQPRVVIEGVAPAVDGGEFPIKRVRGDRVVVEADAFADGHDQLLVALWERHESETAWRARPMTSRHNDRWRGELTVNQLGTHLYMVCACVDPFATWRHGLRKKSEAGFDVSNELQIGADLIEALCAHHATAKQRAAGLARILRDGKKPQSRRTRAALADPVAAWMREIVLLTPAVARAASREHAITVDRERARCSSWYEFFPRSWAQEAGQHGTFAAAERMLEHVAGMGFDIVYLPPIHPIGTTRRKGRNNALAAAKDDVGSPWAIGNGKEGGHKAVHPALGTLADFDRFVAKAGALGLEIALDMVIQCSPDHPYVQEHPDWFRWRPDGTVQHAENPPKKYEDVLPFDFDSADWQALWEELASIFEFWIGHGVKVFRVDNPHTKPLPFWAWLLPRIKQAHPETVFLAEAFTRPKVMAHLAKIGFSQSYTYFAWRNTKADLTQYLSEITQPPLGEYLRGNLWPNTPDILTEHLVHGGRPAFVARAVLAATLGASWGVYGPAYELCERRPREPGSEEYLDSEKYELKRWDLTRADSLAEFLGRLNRIRRDNPALHADHSLRFHTTDNEAMLCYSKRSDDGKNVVIAVVNLDPHHRRSCYVELPLHELGIDAGRPFQMHDLLSDAHYTWHGSRNYLELDPHVVPAHVFRLRHLSRREHDFDYYE